MGYPSYLKAQVLLVMFNFSLLEFQQITGLSAEASLDSESSTCLG